MTPRPCNIKNGGRTGKTPVRTPSNGHSLRKLSPLSSTPKRRLFPALSPKGGPSTKLTKIFNAVEQGNLQMVQDLIQHVAPAVRRSNSRCTLLHTAAANNKNDIVAFLLKLINPNMVNKDMQTPAHLAAMEGHTQVLETLVADKDMNPDLQDLQHKTYKDWLAAPLFEAILSGEEEQAQELLALGANPDVRAGSNADGVLGRELNITTARQLAMTLGQNSIVNLLSKRADGSLCPISNKRRTSSPPENCHVIGDDQMLGPLRIKVKQARNQMSWRDVYKKDTDKKGYVCILSYGSFQGRPDLDLEASEDDAKNQANVFKQMGHTGELHYSLTSRDTKETLMRIRDMEELNDASSATFIISSHGTGNNNAFLASDMERLSTDWLLNLFNDAECPQLKNKPKVFIFDFCCGYYKDPSVTVCQPFIATRVQEPLRDMMCIHSSNVGFTAYNFTKDGSAFNTSLCRTLALHSHDMELNDLYRELITECGKSSPLHVPQLRNIGFTKKFYFNQIVSS